MATNGGAKTTIFNYILDKIGATELNSLIDVEVDGDDLYLVLEDGTVHSIFVVSAGRQEPKKRE